MFFYHICFITFFTTAIFLPSYAESYQNLGSFCNPLEGCSRPSLTCLKNLCECAPGFRRNNDKEECIPFTCEKHEDCNQIDGGRLCNQGSCSSCKEGLFLDETVNRCITLLGYACNSTLDCLPESRLPSSWTLSIEKDNNISSFDAEIFPICRSGRCVCRANYHPNGDWSACRRRKCASGRECNPFSDDPHRYCSKSRRQCLCNVGYFEDTLSTVCLPYVPVHFSMMIPIIMLSICILVYVSRIMTTSNRAANGSNSTENSANLANAHEAVIDHALNRPPPSYETVVKSVTVANTSPANAN